MKEILFDMYHNKNINVNDIINKLNISSRWKFYDLLREHNIKKKPKKIDIISKKELNDLYYNKKYHVKDIANKLKITEAWLYELLNRKNVGRRRTIKRNKHITKEDMIDAYNSSNNYTEAAKKINVSYSWFARHMKKFGLKPRTHKKRKEFRRKNGFIKFNKNKGCTIDVYGRKHIYMPGHPRAIGNYVANAILVKEKEIDRHIKKGEIVHHKNFDCSDDREENLLICSREEHSKIHGGAW